MTNLRASWRAASLAIVVGLLLLCAVAIDAQQPSVAFEAASIKVNRSGSPDSTIRIPPGGTYSATNTTLERLIPNAFTVMAFQVTGAPAWLAVDRFDIVARPPATAKPEDLPAMLQALLADRFALRTHRERQERPIYALIAVDDGKLGPKLTRSSLDCDAVESEKRITPECQVMIGIGRAGGLLVFNGRSLARLASSLGGVVGRVVLDQSGLAGKFDLELKWSAGDASATSNDPEIFSAVREQLGLQLKPATGPVEMLVIDRVERPTAD
jgi:uncharacterized protein (TIGR03435 family)